MDAANQLHLQGLYEFGQFRLDLASGVLSHCGKSVKLAPKVYQALTLLVQNSHRVVSKEEFFTELWPDTFVEDNALSYTISQLRKTLAEHEEGTLIETIPKRGFRFVGNLKSEKALETVGRGYIERETIEELWIEEIDDHPLEGKQLALGNVERHRRSSTLMIASVCLLAAICVAAGWYVYRTPQANKAHSVAVLPVEDISKDGIDRSLLLGMTYALILQLGRSDDLVIRPLNSTLSAMGTGVEPLEVGKKLGVDSIIEWNLQLVDGRYRVNAQLIRVSDGRQLWKESIDHSESDIFKVQDAFADLISRSLIANLSDVESRRLHMRPTENNDAYQAYLRGRFHWNQRTLDGFTKAQGLFEQAIALDPKFAQAFAGLADVHLGFYDYGIKRATDSIPNALTAVEQALLLDPELAEAYSTRASIEFLHNRNWTATEAAFRRAIELSPNDPTPRLRYGWMLSVVGKTPEALEQLTIAEKLDPTSAIVQTNLAYCLMVSGRLAEAEERLLWVKRNAANFSVPRWYLGTIYFLNGRKDESLEEYLSAFAIDDGNSVQADKVRILIAKGSREVAFRTWREDLETRYAKQYFPPTNIALVAALAKDRKQTIRWLEEADRLRDPWLLQIVHDPEYSFLKGDPQFDAILRSLRTGVTN